MNENQLTGTRSLGFFAIFLAMLALGMVMLVQNDILMNPKELNLMDYLYVGY